MKIHEYQAKEILKQHGINTLNSYICFNLKQILSASKKLKYKCAIKAQIHAGGRGKCGGIKIVNSKKEAIIAAESIFNMELKTEQTGEYGKKVNRVLVEESCDISREFYVSFIFDRDKNKICLILSSEGGTDIEEISSKNPEKILKQWINPALGLMPFQLRILMFSLGLSGLLAKNISTFLNKLYKTFIYSDATLTEINPMVITPSCKIIALDAKFNIDDNALFRQKKISMMYDPEQENEREVNSRKNNLSYVALNGNIGCMVNGAGLAMSTMDIIKHVGGNPANFLDVGGSTTKEMVKEALKIILQDKNVKSIFINVFGGIAKCDTIANGLVSAAKELNILIPIIVRLEGTNVSLGREILTNSKLKIISATDMLDGAKKAVEASR